MGGGNNCLNLFCGVVIKGRYYETLIHLLPDCKGGETMQLTTKKMQFKKVQKKKSARKCKKKV
jgi:hypothetical protein